MTEAFHVGARLASIRFAVSGIRTMLKTQHNAWIHAGFTLVVLVLGLFFELRLQEWCFIVICIMAVWTAESFNTALEFLADIVAPEFRPCVKEVKDIAAGAVLIAAIGSVAVGLLVFAPYVFAWWR